MAPSCKQGQEVTSRTADFIFALEGSLHCSIDRIPPTSTSQNGVFLLEPILFECFLARSRTLVSHVVRLGLRWQLSCYCVLQCSKSSFGLQIGFKINSSTDVFANPPLSPSPPQILSVTFAMSTSLVLGSGIPVVYWYLIIIYIQSWKELSHVKNGEN